MFTEYLCEHPLREMLSQLPVRAFPWPEPSPAEAAALVALAEEYRGQGYAQLTASQYMAFARTGDRGVMERPYFQRRRKLIAALMGAFIAGSEADLDSVADGLWLICEESSWVVSAHNGGEHDGVKKRAPLPLPDPNAPYVDLFAAQTAMILSLTCQLLAKKLDNISPLLRRRVRDEIERRVLIPFETRDDFWWMGIIRKNLCNWTPWIVSDVMLAACAWLDDRDRLCALLTRGCGMLDRYLDCIPADGGCDEGVGYWNMAGGAVLDCLDLLERVTGGKLALWSDEKLRNILRFPMKMWLGGDWFANFGDCDAKPEIPGERLQFAGEKLNEAGMIAFGARFHAGATAAIMDTPQLWRLLCALDRAPNASGDAAVSPADVWLKDLEIRKICRGGVTLVCKGGANFGSHNHNDCGSFILFADGEPLVVDAGNMLYTRQTFSDDRYSLWNIRSTYHNVPMVGAFEQAAGREYRARDIACEPDGLQLDIAGAYPVEAGVKALRRTFALDGSGALTLTDTVALETEQPVTWVFLLRYRPKQQGDGLASGAVRVVPDRPMAVDIEEIPVTDPRMAKSFPGSLWRATFTAAAAREHEITFVIERNQP